MNTGCNAGIITTLEQLLGHRSVWSICMLHTNELPLRHLIQALDGQTTSGSSFSGTIGRLLLDTQALPFNPEFPPLTAASRFPSCRKPCSTT